MPSNSGSNAGAAGDGNQELAKDSSLSASPGMCRGRLRLLLRESSRALDQGTIGASAWQLLKRERRQTSPGKQGLSKCVSASLSRGLDVVSQRLHVRTRGHLGGRVLIGVVVSPPRLHNKRWRSPSAQKPTASGEQHNGRDDDGEERELRYRFELASPGPTGSRRRSCTRSWCYCASSAARCSCGLRLLRCLSMARMLSIMSTRAATVFACLHVSTTSFAASFM